MFYKLIRRDSARDRQGSRLYFAALIIAIVAAYTLLSLEKQTVFHFLRRLESDTVQRLLNLIPFAYALSLFFLFFLVYFAVRYHLGCRKKRLACTCAWA